jgi:hypothetical protein
MVILMLRNNSRPSDLYRFPVPARVSEAVKRLGESFLVKKGEAHLDGEDEEELSEDEEDIYRGMEELDDEEFEMDDGVGGVSEEDGHDDFDPLALRAGEENRQGVAAVHNSEAAKVTSARRGRKHPIFDNMMQRPLRDLLFELYTQLPGEEVSGTFFSGILRYCVISSLRADGGWVPANRITETIAALLFTGRLTLYSEMHQRLTEVGHHNYHA